MGESGHECSFAGGLESFGVFVGAEYVDGFIGVCECFEAFEAGLSVVEGGCSHVYVEEWILCCVVRMVVVIGFVLFRFVCSFDD
jgi:hypothetical protein